MTLLVGMQLMKPTSKALGRQHSTVIVLDRAAKFYDVMAQLNAVPGGARCKLLV